MILNLLTQVSQLVQTLLCPPQPIALSAFGRYTLPPTMHPTELPRLRHRMLEYLREAQTYRVKLKGSGPGGELRWVAYERDAMLAAVNAVRKARRVPLVGLKDIETLERRAFGADYTEKMALYCAELALKD